MPGLSLGLGLGFSQYVSAGTALSSVAPQTTYPDWAAIGVADPDWGLLVHETVGTSTRLGADATITATFALVSSVLEMTVVSVDASNPILVGAEIFIDDWPRIREGYRIRDLKTGTANTVGAVYRLTKGIMSQNVPTGTRTVRVVASDMVSSINDHSGLLPMTASIGAAANPHGLPQAKQDATGAWCLDFGEASDSTAAEQCVMAIISGLTGLDTHNVQVAFVGRLAGPDPGNTILSQGVKGVGTPYTTGPLCHCAEAERGKRVDYPDMISNDLTLTSPSGSTWGETALSDLLVGTNLSVLTWCSTTQNGLNYNGGTDAVTRRTSTNTRALVQPATNVVRQINGADGYTVGSFAGTSNFSAGNIKYGRFHLYALYIWKSDQLIPNGTAGASRAAAAHASMALIESALCEANAIPTTYDYRFFDSGDSRQAVNVSVSKSMSSMFTRPGHAQSLPKEIQVIGAHFGGTEVAQHWNWLKSEGGVYNRRLAGGAAKNLLMCELSVNDCGLNSNFETQNTTGRGNEVYDGGGSDTHFDFTCQGYISSTTLTITTPGSAPNTQLLPYMQVTWSGQTAHQIRWVTNVTSSTVYTINIGGVNTYSAGTPGTFTIKYPSYMRFVHDLLDSGMGVIWMAPRYPAAGTEDDANTALRSKITGNFETDIDGYASGVYDSVFSVMDLSAITVGGVAVIGLDADADNFYYWDSLHPRQEAREIVLSGGDDATMGMRYKIMNYFGLA